MGLHSPRELRFNAKEYFGADFEYFSDWPNFLTNSYFPSDIFIVRSISIIKLHRWMWLAPTAQGHRQYRRAARFRGISHVSDSEKFFNQQTSSAGDFWRYYRAIVSEIIGDISRYIVP
jgi:hypothetical protein